MVEKVLAHDLGDVVSRCDLSLAPWAGQGVGINLYLTLPCWRMPCLGHTTSTATMTVTCEFLLTASTVIGALQYLAH